MFFFIKGERLRFLRYIFCALLFVTAAVADTINIKWMDGNTTYAQTTCEIGGDIILPEPPTKRGYTFKGWGIEYTRLEYIESTGTQYIDTGIVYARFVHDIQFTNQASTSSLMGKSASMGMYWGQARSGSAGYEGPGGNIRNIDPTDRRIVEFGALAGQGTYLNIGDTTITGSTNAYSSTYSLLGISGYEEYRCEAKLYDVKAYDENDALVSHLIPARRNSDGVLGMYDLVSNTFFTNQGTGSFIAGPVAENHK